mgnify:FL=1|jgi:hypothetical protein
MTENPEGKKRVLNKDKPEINRGVELLLRNRRAIKPQPNILQVKLQNVFSIFRREISFKLEFHLNISKK